MSSEAAEAAEDVQGASSLPRFSNVKVRHLVVECCYFKFAKELSCSSFLICWSCFSFFFFVPERTFEDHENLVEPLLAWTRDTENKILFQERPEKNEVFKNPQVSGQSNQGVVLIFVALV